MVDASIDRSLLPQCHALQLLTSLSVDLASVQTSHDAFLSRITDADMALETAVLVSKVILLQGGQAILAQANQEPRIPLQLLS